MASINVEKEVLGSIGGIIKIHTYRTADDGHSHSNTDIDLSVPCPDTIPKERHDEFTLDHTIEIKTYEKTRIFACFYQNLFIEFIFFGIDNE